MPKKVFPTKIDQELIDQLGAVAEKLGMTRNGLAELLLQSGADHIDRMIAKGMNPIFIIKTGRVTMPDFAPFDTLESINLDVKATSGNAKEVSRPELAEAVKKLYDDEIAEFLETIARNLKENPPGPKIGHMDDDNM